MFLAFFINIFIRNFVYINKNMYLCTAFLSTSPNEETQCDGELSNNIYRFTT